MAGKEAPPEPAPEPPVAPDNHARPAAVRPGPRRPLRARPVVIESEPDEDEMAFAQPAVDDTDGSAHDPVTAPIPALDSLDDDVPEDAFEDFAAGRSAPGEQVLIRAAQAGAIDDPAAMPVKAPDERRGRRKLRRRSPDPS